ncbi:hypothetical protein ACFXI8_01535 [Streptomyces niveus]|uniref:hypothetical protein n=1 Tax=Streptomyces niveus TaxID=193462 RepID=UPI0036C764C8
MNDGVAWLVLSTSGLLVLLNAAIVVLALWSHRSGLATAWITLNTTVLMASNAFGDPDARPRGFERVVALLALAAGTAALAGFILVVLHVLLWRAWQDRRPRRLRTHCADLLRRESRDRVPLSHVPTG